MIIVTNIPPNGECDTVCIERGTTDSRLSSHLNITDQVLQAKVGLFMFDSENQCDSSCYQKSKTEQIRICYHGC